MKFEESDYKRNNPENYKMKIFYFNPEDERIMVPKLKGFGYGGTFNFARYQSYLIIFAIVVTVVATIYWAK